MDLGCGRVGVRNAGRGGEGGKTVAGMLGMRQEPVEKKKKSSSLQVLYF